MLATQTERAELVPLIDALHQRMRADKVMDFGTQMASAARLASTFPTGRGATAGPLPGGAARRVPGHRARPAHRAVVAVRRRRRRRPGADRRRRPDSVDLRLARCLGDQPAAVHHRLPAAPTAPRRPPWNCAPAGATRRGRCSWPTRSPRRRGAGRWPCASCCPGRTRGPAPSAARCCPTSRANGTGSPTTSRSGVRRGQRSGCARPTAAVLVRRNADAAPMADALTARGVPVEVVGLAGLLGIPEVADVVAMLRLVADPTAGAAAMRVLTGPRWRLGAADIAALWRRAVELDGAGHRPVVGRPRRRLGRPRRRHRLPGRRDLRSRAARIAIRRRAISDRRAGRELTALRAHLRHPLPDLVAEVRRVLGRRREVRAAHRCRRVGRHRAPRRVRRRGGRLLDEARRRRSVGLLAYLDAAVDVENGLAPAEVAVAQDRVQILTVHAAKGLEWQVVAVPHLCGRVFPSTASRAPGSPTPPTCRRCCAATGRRCPSTACRCWTPPTSPIESRCRTRSPSTSASSTSGGSTRSADCSTWRVTRAEDTLLVSGHHWGATEAKPRGPSDFLLEIKDVIDRSAAAGDAVRGRRALGAGARRRRTEPAARQRRSSAAGPPTRGAAAAMSNAGAALVAAAMAGGARRRTPCRTSDGLGRRRRRAAGRAERARAPAAAPALPTAAVGQRPGRPGRDPAGAAQRLQRRLPPPGPACVAGHRVSRLGAAVLRRRAAVRPRRPARCGRRRLGPRRRRELAALQAAFAVSPWAARTPVDVEVPFEMAIGDTVVRGRIDAVFADPDGGVTVVDWKTGEPPGDPEACGRPPSSSPSTGWRGRRLHGCPGIVGAGRLPLRAHRPHRRARRLPDPDELAGCSAGPPSAARCGRPSAPG